MTEGVITESNREAWRSKDPTGNLLYEARKAESTNKPAASNQAAVLSNLKSSLLEDWSDLDGFLQANEAIMKGTAALNLEMMAFGTKRLDEYAGRSESLMRCKDAEEAICIQSDFAQTATLQYFDHIYNLLAIVTTMTEDFLTPLQDFVTKAIEDLTKDAAPSQEA